MKKFVFTICILLFLATVLGTAAKNEMPVLEGTSVKTVAERAKKFGLKELFADEDFGHGTKMKSLSNDSYTLMIDIIYSTATKEILCIDLITSPKTSASQQREFVLGMADVLCPPEDVEEVTSWLNKNIGKKAKEDINGIDYELSLGPNKNIIYDVGMASWEEWDLSMN